MKTVGAKIHGSNAGRYLMWQESIPVQAAEKLRILIEFRSLTGAVLSNDASPYCLAL